MRNILVFLLTFLVASEGVEFKSGAYEEFVVAISDDVPTTKCKEILLNLESTLSTASNYLFSALHGRAFIRTATVILPSTWPNSCSPDQVLSASGESSDVTIHPEDFGKPNVWTQQSAGCGKPGDQIYLNYEALEEPNRFLGHLLVKEFASYRYGVFEERGYAEDLVHPICYFDENGSTKVSGCSDFPIKTDGVCERNLGNFNISEVIDPRARTSIMFGAESSSVSMFCDEGNHDSLAPTKHNLLCNRRNTFDVILQHKDFHSDSAQDKTITNTSTKVVYKRHISTRYIFVIENTKDMAVRESWSFLRSAISKFIRFDLPSNSEVGLVLINEVDAIVQSNLKNLMHEDRYIISSALPYYTADTGKYPCIHCGISKALEMFSEASGPSGKVIILITAGLNDNSEIGRVVRKANDEKVRIATVTYPSQNRQRNLDFIADQTKGVAYTVYEEKENVAHSMISTYFELCNALYNVIEKFYAGNRNDIPLEIHRREIRNNQNSVSSSFYVDENLSGPIKFMLYTHNPSPLIRSMELTSPTGRSYRDRIDTLDVKIISIQPETAEAGTWTYTVEPVGDNPQPHFLQVTAVPKRNVSSPTVWCKFYVSNDGSGPPILYVQVKKGNVPVIMAKVEVRISKRERNGSTTHSETVRLFDSGSGDPDITKHDGIYTRYHNTALTGPGTYTFRAIVNDNENTAYIYDNSQKILRKAVVVSPFEQFLPLITLDLTSDEISRNTKQSVGRILDLRTIVKQDELKSVLKWTSPDMGGNDAENYEIRYGKNVEEITDYFEVKAKIWDVGITHPLSAGYESSFGLDFSQKRDLLNQTLYFAIKATAKITGVTAVSNFVRIFVKLPPPPVTTSPTTSYGANNIFPRNGDYNSIQTSPSNSDDENGLPIIIIIIVVAIIIILLIILGVAYYFFCVKRKSDIGIKSKKESLENDKLNTMITIIPNPTMNGGTQENCYTNDINDSDQTIGIPVSNYSYDNESQKQFPISSQDTLDRNHRQYSPDDLTQLNAISGNPLQPNNLALSPYNCWSASQLLHEHERRHSPADDRMMTPHHEVMNQLDRLSLNGQSVDHISLSSHQMGVSDHYGTMRQAPPPVPPLPVINDNYRPVNYIYESHQPVPWSEGYPGEKQGYEGGSVNGGEKRRRNVTMV